MDGRTILPLAVLVGAVGVCPLGLAQTRDTALSAAQSRLLLNSEPGDPVGGGTLQVIGTEGGVFEARRLAGGGVEIHVDSETSWDARFGAPDGAPLGPGTSEGAMLWPPEVPGAPGLGVAATSECSALSGRFVILEISRAPSGDVQRFAANFEQHCDGILPALFGAVRYNSAVGRSADLAITLEAAPPSVPPGGAFTYVFSVTNHGPDSVAGGQLQSFVTPFPPALSWSCEVTEGSSCGTGGPGGPTGPIDLLVGGKAIYIVEGIAPAQAPSSVTFTLFVTPPSGTLEWNASNDSASVATPIGLPAADDYNDDGANDLVWQNRRTGRVMIWAMNDAILYQAALTVPSAISRSLAWKIVGSADFDGDTRPDILWQNRATGEARIWYMRNAVQNGQALLGPSSPALAPGWAIVGTGDFDGDGRPDVLWQDPSSGKVFLSFPDAGGSRRSEPASPFAPGPYPAWKVVGTADFDGDGKTDILWRSDATAANELVVWYMNGAVRSGLEVVSGSHPTPDLDWSVVAVADYDGDSHPDIVWQNRRTAEVLLWHMVGTAFASQTFTRPIRASDSNWRIVGPR